jgi:hypothetical protein
MREALGSIKRNIDLYNTVILIPEIVAIFFITMGTLTS